MGETELEETTISLNESAPIETIPSICDFTFIPTTVEAACGLYYLPFLPNGAFYGKEIPAITTKGTLSVEDSSGNVKYSKYIEPIFNRRGVADTLTQKGLTKKWSKKFYLNKEPTSVTHVPPPYTGMIDNYVFVWEFDESEFVNTGIPAKIHDIPMASACFINNDLSERQVKGAEIWNGTPYPAFFSYNTETGKYTLTARGIQGNSIMDQLTTYSKVYFYYQLDSSYTLPFNFAMGIEAGDKIKFETDLEDAQPYITYGNIYRTISGAISEFNVEPNVTVYVPRSIEDAMVGNCTAALLLNTNKGGSDNSAAQDYSWIGEGDGVTDYTTQIQAKLDELHTTSNGGTIYLGPGIYTISNSLIVYANTRIIGCGKQTVIKQIANNTDAIVITGNNIVLENFSIKLEGDCTEITACIYANSNNPNGDNNYPSNTYLTNLTMSNMFLSGKYAFEYMNDKPVRGEAYDNYKGVGIMCTRLYFNYAHIDNVCGEHLMATVYGSGGANYFNITSVYCKYAVYNIQGGNNQIFIKGHSYYEGNKTDGYVSMSDYIVYDEGGHSNVYSLSSYDSQHFINLIYFSGCSQSNSYTLNVNYAVTTAGQNIGDSEFQLRNYVTDLGRGNIYVDAYQNKPWTIGNKTQQLSGLSSLAVCDPAIRNVLSGAGIWGSISSSVAFNNHGIDLSEICRYPSERSSAVSGVNLPSVVSNVAPSESNPIEIIIDISNRPVYAQLGYFIQFDHRYVATDFVVSYDTTNDGTYNISKIVKNNTDVTPYDLFHQESAYQIYRIKFTFTKPLQIENFTYASSDYTQYVTNYNPNGLIGICNIGMTVQDYTGRSFLGECGGSLYGNVDMHQNTLKNIADPIDDGDVVNKSSLDNHIKNKSNPHEVTAEQVGALPLTGGIIEQPVEYTQEGMEKIPLIIKAYNNSGTMLKFAFPDTAGGEPKFNIAFNVYGTLGFAASKGGLYWTGRNDAWGSVLRNSKLVSVDTDPTVNGEICWTYK